MRTKYYKAYCLDEQGNKRYLCGEDRLYDTIRGIKSRLTLNRNWVNPKRKKWFVEEYCLSEAKEVDIIYDGK